MGQVDATNATATATVEHDPVVTTVNYVPFPTPPSDSISGIQVFRTQVAPVTSFFLNGEPNPNALTDAWKAVIGAPLYFLTELTRGTTTHIDTASDSQLGFQLDFDTGRIPENPRGIFEWGGLIGLFTSVL